MTSFASEKDFLLCQIGNARNAQRYFTEQRDAYWLAHKADLNGESDYINTCFERLMRSTRRDINKYKARVRELDARPSEAE